MGVDGVYEIEIEFATPPAIGFKRKPSWFLLEGVALYLLAIAKGWGLPLWRQEFNPEALQLPFAAWPYDKRVRMASAGKPEWEGRPFVLTAVRTLTWLSPEVLTKEGLRRLEQTYPNSGNLEKSGPFRKFAEPYLILPLKKLTFCMRGDGWVFLDLVREALKKRNHRLYIGPMARWGHGLVSRFHVREVERDWSVADPDTGMPTRPVPVESGRGKFPPDAPVAVARWRAPLWWPENEAVCYVPPAEWMWPV
jgi:hypothetical protein